MDQAYELVGFPPTMAFANGAALHGVRHFVCGRNGTSVDSLLEQSLATTAPNACTPFGTLTGALSEVDGGVVEHVRDALVRGRAGIRIDNDTFSTGNTRGALAIQVFNNGAWVDHAVTRFLIKHTLSIFEIEDMVPPGMDVRLQVRGEECSQFIHYGFVVAEARIQVETCIPDQSNPGTCL